MNTKTKNIVAVLMATIIAMAMFAPTAMAIAKDIPIEITVPNEPPQIICKCGYPNTVIPDPINGFSPVTICAVVCDENGNADVENGVTATVYYPNGNVKQSDIPMSRDECECSPLEPHVGESAVYCEIPGADDPTCALYRGEFEMVYTTDPAGEYRVVVTANDGEATDKLQNRFFYLSVLVIDMEDNIVFEEIEIGTDLYSNSCTIHNGGNCPIQIGYHFKGFTNDDTGAVAGDLIKFDVSIDETDHWLEICTPWWDGILPGYCNSMDVTFSLHVYPGLLPGGYTGGLEILAKEAPTIRLENKDTSDIDLYAPIFDGRYGELSYDIDTCDFEFNGHGLDDSTEYCLIYYTDDYPGANGWLLGTGTPSGGDVTILGNLPCRQVGLANPQIV